MSILSRIAELIPGTENWPTFEKIYQNNMKLDLLWLKLNPHRKIIQFLKNMKGSKLPIAVAHGEGRAQFKTLQEQKISNWM